MTKEEAIKTLKENMCEICSYGSQNMESCDMRGCDNRDAIKALEQEPCEDTISRQAVLNLKQTFHDNAGYETEYVDIEDIKALPSVSLARPKGKWMEYCYQNFNCSKCGYIVADDDVEEYKFCPNCGADMRGEENG